MINKIELKNFQSHKDTVIDFSKGINVLCGESDNGKSAVIRAIRWVYENRPLGSDKLNSYWNEKFKEKMSVKITFDNETWIKRIRSSSVNGYNYFDGEKVVNLEAVGSDVPREISDFMNMSDVNFQFQFDSPYLLGMTSSEATKYLNKIIHLDSIDEIQTLASSDKRSLSSRKKQVSSDIESYKKKLKDLEWLDEANNIQKRLDVYELKLAEISDILSELNFDVRQYKSFEDSVVDLSKQESLVKEIDELIIEDCSDFADEIESYKKLESSVIDLSEQESIIKEIENISIEDYSDFADEIESYKELEESNANLEKAIEQAVSELPKVCPLCGSEIHGGNCV